MTAFRLHRPFAIVVTALAVAAGAAPAEATGVPAAPAVPGRPAVRIDVITHAHHRAIFCGREGTETSAAYARALARDLRRLQATGRTTAQALALIAAQAC